jgi:hypothetical protein
MLDRTGTKPDNFSPAWHEDVLKAREKMVRESKMRILDWETVKREIDATCPPLAWLEKRLS